MKKLFTIISLSLIVGMSACTSIHKTTKQPYSHVQLERGDFDLSKQKTASATAITILGIDFERLFMKKTGSDGSLAASLPIVGQYLADPTTNYAMYNLLSANEGGDFIFYPQVEKKVSCPVIGICFIQKTTNVSVKSRIGTFK
jgi:hypothetical protein